MSGFISEPYNTLDSRYATSSIKTIPDENSIAVKKSTFGRVLNRSGPKHTHLGTNARVTKSIGDLTKFTVVPEIARSGAYCSATAYSGPEVFDS